MRKKQTVKTVRTTLSLPEALMKEAEPYRNVLNISDIAAAALRRELESVKIRNAADDDVEAMKRRLAQEAQAEKGNAEKKGHADGLRWAVKEAARVELERLERFVDGSEASPLTYFADLSPEKIPAALYDVIYGIKAWDPMDFEDNALLDRFYGTNVVYVDSFVRAAYGAWKKAKS